MTKMQVYWDSLMKRDNFPKYIFMCDNEIYGLVVYEFPSKEELWTNVQVFYRETVDGITYTHLDIRDFCTKKKEKTILCHNSLYTRKILSAAIHLNKSDVIELFELYEYYIRREDKLRPAKIPKLTDREYAALKAIWDAVGIEGYFYISKLMETSNVTRPVFNSLLNKLVNNNCAITENHGSKGMGIRFLVPDIMLILKERKELGLKN